jgi:hemerythrin superfamily protein
MKKPVKKSAKKSSQRKTTGKAKSARKRVNASASRDIISIILQDHQPLKELIRVMKNPDKPLAARAQAFAEFAPLLLAHAKPEQESLYTFLKDVEELREESFEGDVEHQLADQMAEESKRSLDDDQLGARIKVLAELVEHHLKEEEQDMLPEVRKRVAKEDRMRLADQYLEVQAQVISEGEDDAPHESEIDESSEEFLPLEARF